MAVQEHGISAQQQGAAKAVAFKKGFELIVGPLHETGHAGVGVMVRRPGRAHEIPCISEEGRQARQQGRLIIARVDTARGLEVIIISAYCWNGAAERGNLRDKTNALLKATRIEIKASKKSPIMLSVDLNCFTPRFAKITETLDEGGLWDLGNVAHWDLDHRGINVPTCRAEISSSATPRSCRKLEHTDEGHLQKSTSTRSSTPCFSKTKSAQTSGGNGSQRRSSGSTTTTKSGSMGDQSAGMHRRKDASGRGHA